MSDSSRVEDIFCAALEKRTAQERAAYLTEACQNAPKLRREVERLLAAHAQAGDFLGRLPSELLPTADVPAANPGDDSPDLAGTSVGPYKLLEKIGEGGMGVVYMAEQQAPIRRRVALKVIKPGLDTRQVVARFEAERQALALMDHSNIARVFDAGTTDAGRPYFVMELVRGVPITEYCDQNNLPVHERLELFAKVCYAVQHAHQKGIIHRDLKPSNVLVTLNDGSPVPKVIDFGVAKAINQHLTELTVFTNFAQMVGTPLYISPEQAEMSSLDVDTRTDVYSLGVLLYELLTGTTPFDRQRLREAGYDEIRRIIREEEPPRPSTRISTLGQARTMVAAHREVEPNRFSQMVRGDLDWIVMKALEKDRTRRYETASAMAADVKRYLSDEPVEAGPPSAWYRYRKFARRNRAAITSAAAVAAESMPAAISSRTRAGSTGRPVRAEVSATNMVTPAIPVIMQQRLVEIGAWLKVNGEAIYGTRFAGRSCQWSAGRRPVQKLGKSRVKYDLLSQVGRETRNGQAVKQVFFTRKPGALYAIAAGWPGRELVLRDVEVPADSVVTLLGCDGPLERSFQGSVLTIRVPALGPEAAPASYAYAFKITGAKLLPERPAAP